MAASVTSRRSPGWTTRATRPAAVFFDYDRDGRLDLLLLNVGKYTTETLAGNAPYQYYLAFDDAFHGHLMPERAERSLLFHNDGNSRFADVTGPDGSDRFLLVRRRDDGRRQ